MSSSLARALVCVGALTLCAPAAAEELSVGGNPHNDGVVLKGMKIRESDSQPSRQTGSKPAASRVNRQVALCPYNGDTVSCQPNFPQLPREINDSTGTLFTPGMVAEAVSEVPMPKLRLHVQPNGQTLVNVDTIFYTEPHTLETSIELLGHTIDIEAEPVAYTWVYGDGTKRTTTEPGRPYPNKDVTHRYLRPANQVAARVDTVYAVRFAIDGGDWTDLGDNLVATGPSSPVEVREALPVLVH